MSGESANPLQLVVDCDPGLGLAGVDLDDGVALALAALSPAVDLLAVTTVVGNVPVEAGTRVAISLLDMVSCDVRVHEGAGHPLVGDGKRWRALLDGWTNDSEVLELWRGVEPLPPPKRRAAETAAAAALVDEVMQRPGEVTVLAIGPLTNVATAILLEPRFAGSVKRLMVMGGAFNLPGALQELNFSFDPEATAIVLGCGAPMTLLPLDVSVTSKYTSADNERLLHSDDTFLRYLGATLEPWIRLSDRTWGGNGCSLHDPLALALAIDPSLYTSDRGRAAVELHGTYTRGRPVFWTPRDREFAAGLDLPDGPEVDLVRSIDHRGFVDLLVSHLMGTSG